MISFVFSSWIINEFYKLYLKGHSFISSFYTQSVIYHTQPKNATDLLQGINFTGLLQIDNKSQLIKLLTSSNKLVNFIKLQQVC